MKKSLPKFQVDKYRLMELSWNARETFVIHVLSTRIKQVRLSTGQCKKRLSADVQKNTASENHP
jgi:hypothetical protein